MREIWSWTDGNEKRETASLSLLLVTRYLPGPFAWFLNNVRDPIELLRHRFDRGWRAFKEADQW